jgi:hypothetical protein
MYACLGIPLRHFEAVTVLHYNEGEERDHSDPGNSTTFQ